MDDLASKAYEAAKNLTKKAKDMRTNYTDSTKDLILNAPKVAKVAIDSFK